MANVLGGAAADTLAGSAERDYIAAGGGNDTIDSGAGNDWIEGGSGADSFVFTPGCGWDCVGDFKIAEGDRIDLRGWSAIRSTADLTIQADGNDTVVLFGPNDGVRLMGVAASSLTAAQFLFAGGTSTPGTPPSPPPSPPPATGGQTLTGTAARDYLIGGAGNDTITAGAGADYLEGGAGSDVFVCAAGDSWDYIQDFQAGSGGDVLDLRAWGNIRSLADLSITSDASGTSVVFGPNDGMRLNGVLAGTLTAANFRFAEQGSGGPTTPPPDTGGQALTGTVGRDNLVGGAGNDTIAAGAGADYLEGRGGSDTFVARTGDGWDYVQDFQAGAGGDVIDLTGVAGIHGLGDLTFSSDANGTSVVYGSSDGLRLNGVAAGSLTAANFRFAGEPGGGTGPLLGGVNWAPSAMDTSTVERVSVAADGSELATESHRPVLSADGRSVVFASQRPETTPGAWALTNDLLQRDLDTGAVTLVGNVGYAPDGGGARVSADGRYVVYSHQAEPGVSPFVRPVRSVMRRDLQTGATETLYTGMGGSIVGMSDDGRYVAYLREVYENRPFSRYGFHRSDLMVHDTRTGQAVLASSGPHGTANNGVTGASLSADGRCVVFGSTSGNLGETVPMPPANYPYPYYPSGTGTYLRDLQTGTLTRISDTIHSPSFVGGSHQVLLRDSGLSLYDHETRTRTAIAMLPDGTTINGAFENTIIDPTGRYLAFSSLATNLVEGDTNERQDVFIKDLQTGAIVRASVAGDGTQGNGSSYQTVNFTADGRYLGFSSLATNLVEGDTNGRGDAFVADVEALFANQRRADARHVELAVDVNPATPAVAATIDWGEGGATEVAFGGRTRVSVGHTYALTGSTTGTITLTDAAGNTTTESFGVHAGSGTLAGGTGRDVLIGGTGADTVSGGGGADHLAGSFGDDLLDGNEGADVLIGGGGNDTLSGGVGADVFVFGLNSGQDLITDFNPFGDRIQLAAGQDWTVATALNGDALISFGAADGVTLAGVRPDQVSAGLFITG